jgi:hypothetical protein
MTTTTKPLTASTRQYADLLGTDIATAGALLKQGKVQPGAGGKFDLRDALAAAWGDPAGYHPMGRQQLARAEMIELKTAKERRDLIPIAEHERALGELQGYVRRTLETLVDILERDMNLPKRVLERVEHHCFSQLHQFGFDVDRVNRYTKTADGKPLAERGPKDATK